MPDIPTAAPPAAETLNDPPFPAVVLFSNRLSEDFTVLYFCILKLRKRSK